MSSKGAAQSTKFKVVFDGQSLNHTPVIPNSYPYYLMTGRNISWVDMSHSLTGWVTLKSRLTQEWSQWAKGTYNIYIMCGGTTDIELGLSGSHIYNDEVTVAQTAKANGFQYVINTTTTGKSVWDATENTNMANLNTLVKANAANAWDAVCDFQGDVYLGDPTNSTYYVVGEPHWTATGALRAAILMAPYLSAVIAANQ